VILASSPATKPFAPEDSLLDALDVVVVSVVSVEVGAPVVVVAAVLDEPWPSSSLSSAELLCALLQATAAAKQMMLAGRIHCVIDTPPGPSAKWT
jgi:hypothetical protein